MRVGPETSPPPPPRWPAQQQLRHCLQGSGDGEEKVDVNEKMDKSGSCSKQKHPLQDQQELQLVMVEKRTGSPPPSCPQQQYNTVEYDQQETAAKEL